MGTHLLGLMFPLSTSIEWLFRIGLSYESCFQRSEAGVSPVLYKRIIQLLGLVIDTRKGVSHEVRRSFD